MAAMRVSRRPIPRPDGLAGRRGSGQKSVNAYQLYVRVASYLAVTVTFLAFMAQRHFLFPTSDDGLPDEISLQELKMLEPLTPEEANGALGKLPVSPDKIQLTTSVAAASAMSPAKTESKPTKPLALIHVGPMKTGTSTMQYGLKRYFRQLKQDNIISFPRQAMWTISMCIHKQDLEQVCKKTPEWKDLEKFVNQAKDHNYHAVISHEGFWSKPMARELQKMFEDTHHVRILVAYRRWFEWLPSMYSQYHKHRVEWPGFNKDEWKKDEIPSLISYLKSNWYGQHVTRKRRKMFLEDFTDIQLVNIHANENLLQHFLCDVLPNATKACNMPYEGGLKLNLKKTLNYRRLVIAAFEQGLVSHENAKKVKTAWDAAELAEHYHKTEHKKTEQDLPLECLTDEDKEKLWEITVNWEKKLVPDFAALPSSQESMRAKFDKSSKFALCDVNVTAALEQPEWKDFFGKLGTTYVEVPWLKDKEADSRSADASAEVASVAMS